MTAYPTKLALDPEGRLVIDWSDGQRRTYTPRELRDKCPCASCREKRREGDAPQRPLFNLLKPEEMQPLSITGMKPIGNYAYGIAFSDGHDTGLFTLDFLQELGEPA